MSAPVVVRCPHCGTTQATLGECEACHEATTGYFCSNHAPGRWLAGPVCTDCGARVGGVATRPSPAPPPPPPRSRTGADPRSTTSPPDLAPPPRTPPPRPRDRARERPLPPPREPVPPGPPGLPPLPTTLRDLWTTYLPGRFPERVRRTERGARRERRERVEPTDVSPPSPPGIDMSVAVSAGRGIASAVGCVAKVVMLVIIAAILFAVVAFSGMAGVGAPIREWGNDMGQRVGLVEGVPGLTRSAIATYEAGDVASAEQALREAAQTYPRSALALLYLARIRIDAGDLERGGEYLREAVTREPDNAVAHRELAGYHLIRARRWRSDPTREPYAAQELQQAEEHYARALQLAPGDQRARGYLGCVLADQGRTEEAAVEIARAGDGEWGSCVRP